MKLLNFRNINKLDDQEIIRQYRKTGHSKYIGVLFDRYSHLVYGVCLKYLKNEDDSKDMVIVIFEVLMKDLKHVEVQYFTSWLHGVSKNHCLMKIRTDSRLKRRADNWQEDEKAVFQTIGEESIEEKEAILQNLHLAVNQLKPEQKKCVELFYLQEKCYKEVADITGFSMNQVKSFIQNGKRNIKQIMTQTANEIAV